MPIIRIQNLTGNDYQTNYYNKEYNPKYLVKKGDVLISWSASLGVFVWKKEAALLNQHIFKVVFDKIDVDKDYFCLAVEYLLKRMGSEVHGSTMKHITKPRFDNTLFPLPDKDTQKQISKKIITVDKLVHKYEVIAQKLDELIKSRFVEMFGDTEINSKDFPVYKLNDLCTVSSSKRIYQEEQSSSGVPFLRISNLVELIDNNRVESELFIPEEKYNELRNNNLVPKADDILITSRGTLGKCYIIQEKDKFYFQDGMISWLYNLDKCITPLYISLLFDTRDIKRQIENLQSGSTVAYLSIAMLKKLNIVVPPLDLQKQFAAFVAQIDKSKLVVKKQIEKLETLKKSLMQEYFG